MLGGNLSNKLAPRILLTFEGCLATVSDESAFDSAYSEQDYELALACLNINTNVVKRLLYIVWKKDYNVGVVTWYNEDMAAAIEDYLTDNNVVVNGVTSWAPKMLAHELINRPDIMAIYDADPQHVLLFGSKCVLFTDANQIGV